MEIRPLSIVIPRCVIVLDWYSLAGCPLLSVSFEPNFQLERIEPYAFCELRLEVLALPGNMNSISECAFLYPTVDSLFIEQGNGRFVVQHGLFIDTSCHKLIRNFSDCEMIEIPRDVEVLGSYFAAMTPI
jgi:hypothetical protein